MSEENRSTKILNVRLPLDLHEEFVAEAGSEYGARSALFRSMLKHYLASKSERALEQQLREERGRRHAAEMKLQRVRDALGL